MSANQSIFVVEKQVFRIASGSTNPYEAIRAYRRREELYTGMLVSFGALYQHSVSLRWPYHETKTTGVYRGIRDRPEGRRVDIGGRYTCFEHAYGHTNLTPNPLSYHEYCWLPYHQRVRAHYGIYWDSQTSQAFVCTQTYPAIADRVQRTYP